MALRLTLRFIAENLSIDFPMKINNLRAFNSVAAPAGWASGTCPVFVDFRCCGAAVAHA